MSKPGQQSKRKGPPQHLRLVSLTEQPSPLGSAETPPALISTAILDALDMGVAQSTAEGHILYANPRFVETLGRPGRTIVGSRLQDYVEAPSWPSLQEALLQGSRSVTKGEMKLSQIDSGSERTLSLTFAPASNTADMPTVWIVATEITNFVEASKALRESEASLHTLSMRLLQVQDDERRKIARDLHDITGQELAVAVLYLDRLSKTVSANPEAHQVAEDAAGLVRKVESGIRTLSYVLHPPLLDEMGLGSALHWYIEGYTKRTGIHVDLEIDDDLPRFPLEKETAVFRVIQEALTNIFRHSGSRTAKVRVSASRSNVEALVSDSGGGFDKARTPSQGKPGVGIQSMKGRMDLLGGSLDIRSGSRGTRIMASVPLQAGDIALQEDASGDSDGKASSAPAAAASEAPRRVLIADDHDVSRRGIRTVFADTPDFEICGEAVDGLEAVRKAAELKPDLIILDLSMPKVRGFSAAAQIRNLGFPTKIVIYTSHDNPVVERAARTSGCDGYVRKSDASQDLLRAARAVLAGDKFWSTESSSASASQ